MLDDLGVDAAYTHDGSDHKDLRDITQISADKSRYKRQRILFLTRDPRDTAVSGYFQVSKRHGLEAGPIGDCIRSPKHGVEKIALSICSGSQPQLTCERLRFCAMKMCSGIQTTHCAASGNFWENP